MQRNLQIDFLRFIAVLSVVFFHLELPITDSLLNKTYHLFSRGGWIGVDLFFVLSGYLVTRLILNEYKILGKVDIKRFLIRRGFKIYPLYYIALLFQFFYHTYFNSTPQSSINLFYESVFIANYLSLNNIYLWSVCVEEHFYLIISLLFYIIQKHKLFTPRLIIPIYLVTLVIAIGIRLFNYIEFESYDFYRDYLPTHMRIHGLFAGSGLAYLTIYNSRDIERFLENKALNLLILCISIILLLGNFIWYVHSDLIGSTLFIFTNPVCFIVILINMLNLGSGKTLNFIRPLAYVGKFSYPIYLFHMFFLNFKYPLIDDFGALSISVRIICVFSGGILIGRLVETPLLKIRDFYFPSKSKSI